MLKDIRKKIGMTQKELATASGVNLRMIQFYEQGFKDIAKAEDITVKKLADALGCETDDLITDDIDLSFDKVFTDEGIENSTPEERQVTLKIERAKYYSGFRDYPSTCEKIFSFIPDTLFNKLASHELAEVAKAINIAYHAGEKEATRE